MYVYVLLADKSTIPKFYIITICNEIDSYSKMYKKKYLW